MLSPLLPLPPPLRLPHNGARTTVWDFMPSVRSGWVGWDHENAKLDACFSHAMLSHVCEFMGFGGTKKPYVNGRGAHDVLYKYEAVHPHIRAHARTHKRKKKRTENTQTQHIHITHTQPTDNTQT